MTHLFAIIAVCSTVWGIHNILMNAQNMFSVTSVPEEASRRFIESVLLVCFGIREISHVNRLTLCIVLQSHKYGGQKCGAYWDCNNGRSVPKCCDDGHRYVFGKGCVQDPDCHDICPWKDETQACDKRPVLDMTSYEQSLGNGLWVKMSCAPGTAYNIIDCECSLNTGILPGYVCRPELEMDFDDKQIRDKSGKNVYVFNDGVIPWEDAAYFNGSARLLINRFSNTDFHGHLVIKLRYKEQLTDKEWKEVIYIHDEKNLEGKVCGASYKKWSLGPIQATHCGVQFGYGTKMENFVGLMDDVSIEVKML
ncbi:PIF-like protein [Mya arenaria]|uniref:PIF-like protein n=1 Tax=Mya arenaria TaxID=6604 RepID=A0ABY7DVX1_MYAAR|nr:PIF-like protein [Mya arenaria]